MSRQFGLTSRSASGAQPPTGSLHGHDTQPDFPRSPSSFLESPRSVLESRQLSDPLLDERELGASLLFSAVLILPPFIVALVVIGYLKFIS
jgi:hypothetical protein